MYFQQHWLAEVFKAGPSMVAPIDKAAIHSMVELNRKT